LLRPPPIYYPCCRCCAAALFDSFSLWQYF